MEPLFLTAPMVPEIDEGVESPAGQLRHKGSSCRPLRRAVALRWYVLAAASYLAVAVTLFSDALRSLGSRTVGGPDAALFAWFLSWDWYAVSHLRNPFLSDRIGYPDGVNVMWNTSMPIWGWVFGPLTAARGPIATLTILGVLGLAASGATAFWLGRELGLRPAGSFILGLVYELSPFLYVHTATAHLMLTVGAIWVPLLAVFAVRLARRRGSPVKNGLALGLCLGAELLTSEEFLAAGALVFGAGLVLIALLRPAAAKRNARSFLGGAVMAVSVLALIGAWPLATQMFGPQTLVGRGIQNDFGGATFYSLDLANLVVPSVEQFLNPSFLHPIAAKLTGTPAEQTGYLGLPLLLLLVAAGIRFRADLLVQWLLLLTAAIVVLALGPRLHIGGQIVPGLRLPLAILLKMPVLENLIPDRLMAFAFLTSGLVTGRVVDDVLAGPGYVRWTRGLGVAAVALCLVPLIPRSTLPTSPVSHSAYLERHVPSDVVVAVFPYPSSADPNGMFWSASSGIRYKFVGGYAIFPDPARPHNILFSPRTTSQVFWQAIVDDASDKGHVDPALVQREHAELSALGVRYVVLGTEAEPLRRVAENAITRAVAEQPRNLDGALVWQIR